MGLTQYLKDTRGELRHVAWPTRVQTVVYTFIVIALSISISLYLGFADFLMTTALGKVAAKIAPVEQPVTTQELPASTTLPFAIPTSTKK